MFEELLPVASPKLAREALAAIARRVGAKSLFPGLDDASFDPYQYFERGFGWLATGAQPLPPQYLWEWLVPVFSSPKLVLDQREARVPFSRVFPALVERYPDLPFTDESQFVEGARCKRFWDPAANNETACIVKPDGILCFTGHEPFMRWSDLLGKQFMDDFDADRIGAATQDYWYDGQYFWKSDGAGEWVASSIADVRNACKVAYGLSSKIASKETSSEVDRAIYTIQTQKRVYAAVPMVHFPKGPIRIPDAGVGDLKPVLNTSGRIVAPPHYEPVAEWGDRFPWIAKFLEGLFGGDFQRNVFLAWLQRFYRGAVQEKPTAGQALFLAGPPACGKSLLAFRLVADAVGGASQADSFVLGETSFSGSFLDSPVMMVDDGEVSNSLKSREKYYSRIKKLVASPSQTYNSKFQKEKDVIWRGRVLVTLNDDPSSLETLPAMQMSLMDKVIMLKCQHSGVVFGSAEENNAIIQQELPFFLSWLLQWTPSLGVLVPGSRFGVKSFVHPELQDEARDSSGNTETIEILSLFLTEWESSENSPENGLWRGTTSELLSGLRSCDTTKRLVDSRMNPRSLGRKLRALKSSGLKLRSAHTRNGTEWEISKKHLDFTRLRREDQRRMGYIEQDKQGEQGEQGEEAV